MNRWVSEHKAISFILYNVIFWSSFLLLSTMVELHLITWIVYGIVILLISLLFISSIDIAVLKEAAKQHNNQCDPYSLLEIVEQQLQRVKSRSYKQMLLIDKAVALRDLGRFDEVYSILTDIHIDQYNTTQPSTKIVYYNNLVDILIIKGDLVQANIWYTKMMQMINDLNEKVKQKHQLSEISVLTQAELLFTESKYEEAESLVRNISDQIETSNRIAKYMLYAKLCIRQNRYDEAKPFLQFIIDYGSKLYKAVLAREMLNSIS